MCLTLKLRAKMTLGFVYLEDLRVFLRVLVADIGTFSKHYELVLFAPSAQLYRHENVRILERNTSQITKTDYSTLNDYFGNIRKLQFFSSI